MKKMIYRLSAAALSLWLLMGSVSASSLLVPVGELIGLEIQDRTVTVAGFDTAAGRTPESTGLEAGDILLKINKTSIGCVEDVRSALSASDGTVQILVQRGSSTENVRLEPMITNEGPRLGVYLRQGVTGVGTVTWYDPDTGSFGALGHGVNTQEHLLVDMTQGNAYRASVVSVKKGRSGDPGQLIGTIRDSEPIGPLLKNTEQGVFGKAKGAFSGQELPVASVSEIQKGPATILSTVLGQSPQEYSVEILKIYPTSAAQGRNMLLRVTDSRLLDTTGGIVQGMSGSPIIQDGKLVGAVTHVLVNDPTTGYGIFIENMLDAA